MKFSRYQMNSKSVFSFLLLFLFTSCIPYSTLQTPETLPEGKFELNGGAGWVGETAFALEVGSRYGLFDKVDMGLKFALPGILLLDGKYKFYDSGIKASADMGVSYYLDATAGSAFGFYPMILIGQEVWYAGVKGNFFSTAGDFSTFGMKSDVKDSHYLATSLVTGFCFGKEKTRLLFELNTFIPVDSKVFFVPSVGVAYRF